MFEFELENRHLDVVEFSLFIVEFFRVEFAVNDIVFIDDGSAVDVVFSLLWIGIVGDDMAQVFVFARAIVSFLRRDIAFRCICRINHLRHRRLWRLLEFCNVFWWHWHFCQRR